MAQLGHKNHLCDAWSCASFGNKDKHNQTAGTQLRKFHRSCALLNTLPYAFFIGYPTSGLLFNCVLCFNTIDGATDNLQYCFDNAVQPDAFQYFQVHEAYYCIWYCTVYGSVNWMTEPTDCRGKGRKTWRRVYSTNFIQFQPHHLQHLFGIRHK